CSPCENVLQLICSARRSVEVDRPTGSRSVSGTRERRRRVCESTGSTTEPGSPRHGLPVCNTQVLVCASGRGENVHTRYATYSAYAARTCSPRSFSGGRSHS